MYKLAAIALASSLLVGCATTGAVDTRLCPTPRKYTQQEQTEFLNAIGKSPPIIGNKLVPDYLDLRDQARACKAG